MYNLPSPFSEIPFHRLSYAHPSPIHSLPRLTQHARSGASSASSTLHLWAKREDQAGPLVCYGNKYRKFEYIIPDILARKDTTTIVTEGGVQSNHTVQVAGIAALLNLKCTVLLHQGIGGLRKASNTTSFTTVSNVQLSRLLGADVRLTREADTGDQHGPLLPILDELKASGEVPYWISSGASLHPLGGLGYARCAFEIVSQELQLSQAGQLLGSGLFDLVFVACGSGSTLAGLIAGFKLLAKAKESYRPSPYRRVIGIMTSPTKSRAYQEERILNLARTTGKLIGLDEGDITSDDVILEDAFVGEGYGILDMATAGMVNVAAATDSLLLDPVYTAKVMRGMLDWAGKENVHMAHRAMESIDCSKNALFMHTGGQSTLSAYADVWPSTSEHSPKCDSQGFLEL